ncbi:MAG: hypothetical protein WBL23_03215 [Salinisphaera sp.]
MSVILGLALIALTVLVTAALAFKANKSVVEFDEDKHELFVKGRH